MSCSGTSVNEGSGCVVSWAIEKATADLATVTAVSYWIDDFDSEASILAPTAATPGLTGDIVVTAAQNAILNDDLEIENHVVTVTATFSAGEPATQEIIVPVVNLRFIS